MKIALDVDDTLNNARECYENWVYNYYFGEFKLHPRGYDFNLCHTDGFFSPIMPMDPQDIKVMFGDSNLWKRMRLTTFGIKLLYILEKHNMNFVIVTKPPPVDDTMFKILRGDFLYGSGLANVPVIYTSRKENTDCDLLIDDHWDNIRRFLDSSCDRLAVFVATKNSTLIKDGGYGEIGHMTALIMKYGDRIFPVFPAFCTSNDLCELELALLNANAHGEFRMRPYHG